jgi:hypothetical protein
MYLLKSQPKISRSKSFPRAYFSSNSGSAFTILHPVELFGAMAQQIRKGREHCALPFRLDLRESL